jgi:thiopeptide-type bacteriocin biosynthesis protein
VERAVDETGWLSAHAFYHGDLDALLTGAVAPLVGELAAADAIDGWFFLRYWEGGPHVRLRIRPAWGRRAEVERWVRDRLRGYLRTHRSPDRMRQHEYLQLAPMLAQRERMDRYATRMYRNNTVSFIPYRREHDRYGDGASVEAVERHFVESSRIALALLTAGTTVDQRATAACAVILLTWLAGEPDLARTAELIGGPSPAATAAADQRARAVGIALRVSHLPAAAAHVTRPGTFVDWYRSATALRDTLAREAAAGSFVPPERGWKGYGAAAPEHPGTGVLPVLDICAHLFCNRLGLPLGAEDAVRAVAADAVRILAAEQAAGQTATEKGTVRGMA